MERIQCLLSHPFTITHSHKINTCYKYDFTDFKIKVIAENLTTKFSIIHSNSKYMIKIHGTDAEKDHLQGGQEQKSKKEKEGRTAGSKERMYGKTKLINCC